MKETEIIDRNTIQVDADVIRHLQDKIEDLEQEVDDLKLTRSLDKLAEKEQKPDTVFDLFLFLGGSIAVALVICELVQVCIIHADIFLRNVGANNSALINRR